jgi:hypothetical protein
MTQNQNTSRPETPIAEEPQGDLGQGHKTWARDPGEQGISNRPDDEVQVVPESDEADDAAAFADDEEDDADDVDDDDDDDDEDEEDEGEEDEDETDA